MNSLNPVKYTDLEDDGWEIWLGSPQKIGMMDKTWLRRTVDGKTEYAVFKKDSGENIQSVKEVNVYNTAEAFKFNCCETEAGIFDGMKGILSRSTKDFSPEPKKEYLTAYQYFGQFGLKASLKAVQKYAPDIERDAVNMFFNDCLTVNQDRHNNNWEVEVDKADPDNYKLYPMFDFDRCFEADDDGKPFREYVCRAIYGMDDDEEQNTQEEMFAELCADYPQYMRLLLDNAKTFDPPLNDFCQKRLDTMNDIYENHCGFRFGLTRDNIIFALMSKSEQQHIAAEPDDIIASAVNKAMNEPSEFEEMIARIMAEPTAAMPSEIAEIIETDSADDLLENTVSLQTVADEKPQKATPSTAEAPVSQASRYLKPSELDLSKFQKDESQTENLGFGE